MQASGDAIINALKFAEVRTVVALPDIVTCADLLWPISGDPNFKLISICKEDEGVSICAGLSYCNERAILLMQNTGFLDSINAIRAIAVDYQLPIVMMVGLQGIESDREMSRSHSMAIRSLPKICSALDLAFEEVREVAPDVLQAGVAARIRDCYVQSAPHVFFLH